MVGYGPLCTCYILVRDWMSDLWCVQAHVTLLYP